MNTDLYTALHPHDPPDPRPRLPEQTSFKVWAVLPPTLTGLFVVAYSGPNVVAFLGPFLGIRAVEALIFRIFDAARALGADSYEIARKE